MTTVFIAMSGGSDSSYAALLLKRAGYRVVGVTFSLRRRPSGKAAPSPYPCPEYDAAAKAKAVADHLSIPHHVIDLSDPFQEFVIDRFVEEYRRGRTPNPCVLCNRYIKFGALLEAVRQMGDGSLATGHYATIEETGGRFLLNKGTDPLKDQSYFLYAIQPQVLKDLIFPLGRLRKADVQKDVRTILSSLTLAPESQDICFIPGRDYRAFLGSFIQLKKGPVYHVDGTLLGYHEGVHLYTVGQRRGLGIPFSSPLYVIAIRPDENALIVGPREHLDRNRLYARDVNFFFSPKTSNAFARTRYNQKEIPCTFRVSGDTLEIDLLHPSGPVTPGQSVVLYRGEAVLGGGIIERGE
jgi:tRNA-uridine 2-sulfurtransferase